MSGDPTDVRAIAVRRDEVVAALEANVRRDAGTVLRVTPPFAGRMRARLHRKGTGSGGAGSEDAGSEDAGSENAGGEGAGSLAAEGGGAERGTGDEPTPVHVEPASLVEAVPPYPAPDETADELRAADEEYSRERHRERHEERVRTWRETVGERLRDRATLPTPAGPHEVEVTVLG